MTLFHTLTDLVITNNSEPSACESDKDASWMLQGDSDFKYSLLLSNLITSYNLILSLRVVFPECTDLFLLRKKLACHFPDYSSRHRTFSHNLS